MSEKAEENTPAVNGDARSDRGGKESDSETIKPLDLNGQGKTTPDEPRAPAKKPVGEIPLYPSIKAQSLPIQAQTLKERNKRVGENLDIKILISYDDFVTCEQCIELEYLLRCIV